MAQATAEPGTPNRSVLKLALLITLALVALIGASAATAWFFFASAATDPAAAAAAPANPMANRREPLFVPLEQFTVNLADDGGERMAQIGVTLEVADARTDKALRVLMPAIRNSILLLLSSKTSAELLTVPGKEALAADIARHAAATIGWDATLPGAAENPVVAVHFAQFIVQ